MKCPICSSEMNHVDGNIEEVSGFECSDINCRGFIDDEIQQNFSCDNLPASMQDYLYVDRD